MKRQGGFSKKLFKNEIIQDYINGCLVYGWVGHSERNFKLDSYLKFKRNNNKAKFIISKRGRWLGDKITFADNLDEKKEIIKNSEHITSFLNYLSKGRN